jgi:hypothetical protein
MQVISPIGSVKKIGIIGTNSAGKSTMAYEVLWRLKKAGCICDGVIQQDRRLGFKSEYLDTNLLAQFSIFANQMKVEADMCMGDGIEMLITDRTPFDLYCYYLAVFGGNDALSNLIDNWCRDTFTRIYLLRPVAYEATAARQPTEDFRDRVNKVIIQHAVRYLERVSDNIEIEPADPIVAKRWRKELPFEIVHISGRSSVLGIDATRIIVDTLKCDVLIGGSYALGTAHVKSDLDIHVMVDQSIHQWQIDNLSELLKVDIHLLRVPNKQVWDYLVASREFIEVEQC